MRIGFAASKHGVIVLVSTDDGTNHNACFNGDALIALAQQFGDACKETVVLTIGPENEELAVEITGWGQSKH